MEGSKVDTSLDGTLYKEDVFAVRGGNPSLPVIHAGLDFITISATTRKTNQLAAMRRHRETRILGTLAGQSLLCRLSE